MVRREQPDPGATASGKTTLSKALIAAIPPHERLSTIEDTPELVTASGCSTPGTDRAPAKIGRRELLESSLRMRPDRILLQELRDGSASLISGM
ncbi:ATPase, T2SS/T4P/T4SS family [Bradyrhizobium yuanmingense]|uniref:ATPase, T2SS/T4P/T4SS family n=1 Tax=Bradyrhizobium yuanmingense TaxID=108015 RepID=UPI003CC52B44